MEIAKEGIPSVYLEPVETIFRRPMASVHNDAYTTINQTVCLDDHYRQDINDGVSSFDFD